MNKCKHFLALTLLSLAPLCVVGMKKNESVEKQREVELSTLAKYIIECIGKNGKEDVVNSVVPLNLEDTKTDIPLLHAASCLGDPFAVNLLLANGANVTKRDNKGLTAIEYALAEGHAEIVFELLCYGALDCFGGPGVLPVFGGVGKRTKIEFPLKGLRRKLLRDALDANCALTFINKKKMNIVTFKKFFKIICGIGRWVPLLYVDGDDDKVKSYLDAMALKFEENKETIGLRGSVKDYCFFYNKSGWTALDVAVGEGYPDVCKCLLELKEKKFDVNRKDNFGCTPLYWAVKSKKLYIFYLLIKYGAYDNENCQSESVLDLARKMLTNSKDEKTRQIYAGMIETLKGMKQGGSKKSNL